MYRIGADNMPGICVTENAESRRLLDEHYAEDEREKEERYLRAAFLADATESQADKYALFAPRVRDHKNGGTCLQTVGEVLFDALDYKDYIQRAMQVLLNAANGKGTQRDAQMLLEEVAASWAGRQE
jgi:hypothetical protein